MNYHLGMGTMRLWGVENSFKHLFSIPFKIRLITRNVSYLFRITKLLFFCFTVV